MNRLAFKIIRKLGAGKKLFPLMSHLCITDELPLSADEALEILNSVYPNQGESCICGREQ